ncbi:MAG TPA: SIS domain-containing protein [Albitalea sp.]|nr:SIS domain-containing protein [Albitalea sp.]
MTLIARLDAFSPGLFATIARGSSDHAADFAAYAVALQLRLPGASLPLSLASVYGQTLRLERALVLAVSQSGASPDLALAVRAAREGGACCVGLLNEARSPLAHELDVALRIGAGPERAVAATKSFVLSVTAVLHLISAWARDSALGAALHQLPDTLARLAVQEETAAVRMLSGSEHVFVVGRGPAWPMARELALKLQEVPGLHAQAHSAAELLHGPITLATDATPAIVFAGDSRSHESVLAAVSRLQRAGAPVLMLAPEGFDTQGSTTIRLPAAGHALLQPLVSLCAMYPVLAQLARERGRNPDSPPHVEKAVVTR